MLAGFAMLGGIFFPGCSQPATTRKRTSPMGALPTSEEMNLLSNIDLRRKEQAGMTIKISNRAFGNNIRFDHFEWEDIHFINCDFIGCLMFDGTLRNVRFTNCLFFANRWDGGRWEDVSFKECAWRGNFDMGVRNGDKTLTFEDCEFIASTAKELGYGGRSEYFGGIGGTNGSVLYQRCNFERTYINGGSSTELRDCNMLNVVVSAKVGSSILLEDIRASELVDFRNKAFSTVAIKKSSFTDRLTFNNTKIDTAVFEDFKANLDLTLVKARSIELRRVTFVGPAEPKPQFKYGLTCESAKIFSLTIDDCSFQGRGAALFLSGEQNWKKANGETRTKAEDVYSTSIENLSIRRTPINSGGFEYMDIGNLLLENLVLGNADFSNTTIRKFVTRNVTLSGKLKLENTNIVERATDLSISSLGNPEVRTDTRG
jgi:uncharacterized protein YjbI with pentapeptide repeats